jgi:hypothetical protein
MILHESWISHAIIGGGSADTAIAFLEQNGQDEARVDAGLASNLLNASTDDCRLVIRVSSDLELCAPAAYNLFIGIKPVVR